MPYNELHDQRSLIAINLPEIFRSVYKPPVSVSLSGKMPSDKDTKNDTLQTAVEKKKYRVMIVDDEQDITAIFKIGLEKNEFIVTTYNDPLKAISEFRPGTYDLLILDIRMPGMNGFELYKKIRDMDSEVKVCFLTAFDEYKAEFKKAFPFLDEVKCYLKKPITIQDMIKKLLDLAIS